MSANIHLHIIYTLNLPPSTQSINLLNQLKHFKFKQYTIYYLPYKNKFLLTATFNHFNTLTNPLTKYNLPFTSFNQLYQFITTTL